MEGKGRGWSKTRSIIGPTASTTNTACRQKQPGANSNNPRLVGRNIVSMNDPIDHAGFQSAWVSFANAWKTMGATFCGKYCASKEADKPHDTPFGGRRQKLTDCARQRADKKYNWSFGRQNCVLLCTTKYFLSWHVIFCRAFCRALCCNSGPGPADGPDSRFIVLTVRCTSRIIVFFCGSLKNTDVAHWQHGGSVPAV